MEPEYSFDRQLAEGEGYEQEIDRYFSKHYIIKTVTMQQQRMGIDRTWKNRNTGVEASMEYKADKTAAITSNVFIETISVDEKNKPGWAYSSLAQWLVTYIPPMQEGYITEMTNIKRWLPEWIEKYPEKPIRNIGRDGTPYTTKGVPVPLSEFTELCKPKKFTTKPNGVEHDN